MDTTDVPLKLPADLYAELPALAAVEQTDPVKV